MATLVTYLYYFTVRRFVLAFVVARVWVANFVGEVVFGWQLGFVSVWSWGVVRSRRVVRCWVHASSESEDGGE